jgi:hypothetical protein
LAEIERKADCIGWAFHDYVVAVVGKLADELGKP